MAYLDVDGSRRIYFEQHPGPGRPVVLVHGWGATARCWDTVTPALRARGHQVELIALPFVWDGLRVLDAALQWRLVDLGGSEAKPADLVIGTKFPSYGIRHPNKVVWLVHQFRQAYDFDRGEYRAFSEKPLDRATR